MRRTMIAAVILLAGIGLAVGCLGDEAAPELRDGPTVTVDVAALSLAGVGDVVWDLEVANGAEPADIVWHQRITSSRFGDGAGSASYVGPCDASPGVAENDVRLWVVGVYGAAVNVPGAFGDAPPGGALAFENPTPYDTTTATWAAPMSQSAVCAENADRPVRFDVALMRPAQQGFFDIAVNFNDIFCSAKFDCCIASEQGCPDIMLLHDGEGKRSTTFVLGFACTAGSGAQVETELYLDDLLLDCTSSGAGQGFSADLVIDPSGTPGNQCAAEDVGACGAVTASRSSADDYLYQVAIYRGLEALTSGAETANKVYWNIALGVVRQEASSVGIENCRLRTRGTADDARETELVDNGVIAAGVVYPFIQWDVDLGSCGAESLTFGDANAAVQTAYTTTSGGGTAFTYGYGPNRPADRFCAATCVHGACVGGECACEAGWEGPTCSINIDDCEPNPCQNGGVCNDGLASYSCSCPEAYTGDDCEIPLGPFPPTGFVCDPGTAVCANDATDEVWIPGGDFWRGCNEAMDDDCEPNEKPQHLVTLSEYLIDRHEVTVEEYGQCVGTQICEVPTVGNYYMSGTADHPINFVDWEDARVYCEWNKPGKGVGRLCTEAEWEMAARGSCDTVAGDCKTRMRKYPWDASDGVVSEPTGCDQVNWSGCSNPSGTSPKGSYPNDLSPYGVFDMAGNVSEWVSDWYDTYYDAHLTNPQGPPSADVHRVIRGGAFKASAPYLRASSREYGIPRVQGYAGHDGDYLGFRCCREVD